MDKDIKWVLLVKATFFPCKILLDSLINLKKKKMKQIKTTFAIFLLVGYLLIIYLLSQKAEDLCNNEMLYNIK